LYLTKRIEGTLGKEITSEKSSVYTDILSMELLLLTTTEKHVAR